MHDRDSIRHQLDDSVFAGQDLATALPKYRFPDNEVAPGHAYQVVADELMLDGNAVAGLLQEVFAVEMTTAIETCNACGATNEVGALHVFRGAGIVMRCPHCDNALVTIAEGGARIWIGFAGVRTLQVTV